MKYDVNDLHIIRSESKVDRRTEVLDEDFEKIMKVSSSFTDEQIIEIITLINQFYGHGMNDGRKEAQKEVREALGIFESYSAVSIGDSEVEATNNY